MKKIFSLTFVGGLFVIVLLSIFSSCKKESSNDFNLTGRWLGKISFPETDLTYQYRFNSDHSFEYTSLITNKTTKEVIGTPEKMAGQYEIKGLGSNTYKLITVSAIRTDSLTITMNNEMDEFSISFSCPIFANCAPSPVFHKQ